MEQVTQVIHGTFFLVGEINHYYYAVAVGKNHNIVGIYADVKKFKKEIEGVAGSIYESCGSYDQAHKKMEDYLHQQKEDQLIESSALALADLKKKINILGYEDLTQKQQEQARRHPK
jgi:viroplasmin and RNaseH domain-containing protein